MPKRPVFNLPAIDDEDSISRWEFNVGSLIFVPYEATIVTADATTSSLILIPLQDDRIYGFRGFVTAKQTGGSAGNIDDAMAWYVFGGFFGSASTATKIPVDSTNPRFGDINLIGLVPQTLAWTVAWNTLAENVAIDVTGEANKTIQWTCKIEQLSII